MSMLYDAEKPEGSSQVEQSKIKEMYNLGTNETCIPYVVRKRDDSTCPLLIEIKVNGRTLKGNLCDYTCYKYKGKRYDVGYCK